MRQNPVKLLRGIGLMTVICCGLSMGSQFLDDFDYCRRHDFEAAWGKPVLGGHVVGCFRYVLADGNLQAVELSDIADGDGGLATAVFSHPLNHQGDFVMRVDLTWRFMSGDREQLLEVPRLAHPKGPLRRHRSV